MNTITVIMADEPLDAHDYAFEEGFAPVLWPEVADGMPVSNAVLFARVDKWIARLSEESTAVVTHSALLAHRLRRRVAEGVLSPEAVRFVYLSGGEVRTLDVNQFGVVRTWPNGWCDADSRESAAIVAERFARRGF